MSTTRKANHQIIKEAGELLSQLRIVDENCNFSLEYMLNGAYAIRDQANEFIHKLMDLVNQSKERENLINLQADEYMHALGIQDETEYIEKVYGPTVNANHEITHSFEWQNFELKPLEQ